MSGQGTPEHTREVAEHLNLEPPERMTAPALGFYVDLHRSLSALGFFYSLAHRVDVVWDVLDDELRDAGGEPKADRPPSAKKKFATFSRFLQETILVRAVANYFAYLGDLLSLVMVARPEVLRTPDPVRLDEVLRHTTMDDFVASVAEQRVANLTQQGIADLDEDLSRRLGIPLFESADMRQGAVVIVDLRNLLLHNRGVIDRRFKRRLPDYPGEIGETVVVAPVTDKLYFLSRSVASFDALVADKFGIPQSAIRDDVGDAVWPETHGDREDAAKT